MGAAMTMDDLSRSEAESTPTIVERGQIAAIAVSILLHLLAVLLLVGWQVEPPLTATTASVEARLIALPSPAPVATQALPPPAAVATKPPAAAEAELARRRIERDEQLKRQRQQQIERQRVERERLQQQLERDRREQAEQRALAEAQQSRLAAERAAAQAAAAEAASRRYEPIEKIAPGYPTRAMERRIEGDCTVRYTVSTTGRVESPEVVGNCHPLFVVPSLTAAKRFRYQPRMVDGRAVAVPGVTNTFHYRIQAQQ